MPVYSDSAERTLNKKLGEFPSLLDFSVTGDGTTDDTANVQDALDATAATPGRVLYVPGGTYEINDELVVPAGVQIVGMGSKSKFIRGSNLAAGKALFSLPNSDCSLENFVVDGQVTASTGIDNTTLGTTLGGNPMHDTLTENTSVWIRAGAKRVTLRGLTVTHTGGYSVIIDARAGNIEDVAIEGCEFLDNRPHKFGPIGDTNYGSWTGGVLYTHDGTSFGVNGLKVSRCRWKRCTGNCLWGHGYAFTSLHRNIAFTDNRFQDFGLDAILVGNTLSGIVSGNHTYRGGYLHSSDVDTPVPLNNPATYSVALDTSGCVQGVDYVGNSITNQNGGGIDLDGFFDGSVSGNSITNSLSGDPYYSADGVGSYGPTVGIQTGNSFFDKSGRKIDISNNTIIGMNVRAISLKNAKACKISGNKIFHLATAAAPPILIFNVRGESQTYVEWQADSSEHRSYGNVVTGNEIEYTADNHAIAEIEYTDGVNVYPFQASDVNRVFDNDVRGTNRGELLRHGSSASVASHEFPTNDSFATGLSKNIAQREGFGVSAAWKLYRRTAASQDQILQVSDAAFLNASVGGAVNTGNIATGNRTTSAFPDTVLSGKAYLDAFGILTGATYSDAEANTLDNTYTLYRRNPSNGKLQQSYATSAGARVWEDMGGGASTGVINPVFNINDFGAFGDGASHLLSASYASLALAQAAFPLTTAAYGISLTDEMDWAATQEAILSCPDSGGTVYMPYGSYRWNNEVKIGNGNSTTASTRNNVKLIGAGWGMSRTVGSEPATLSGATYIQWTGGSGGSMLRVLGPVAGVILEEFVLDGKDVCDYLMYATHQYNSAWKRILMHRPRIYGMILDAYPDHAGIGVGSTNCVYEHVYVKALNLTTANGMKIGGDTSGFHDINQSVFINCGVQAGVVSHTGTGVEIGYADFISFYHLFIGSCGKSIYFRDPAGTTAFPGQIMFYSYYSGVAPSWSPTWAPSPYAPVRFVDFVQDANEPEFPRHAGIVGNTVDGKQFGSVKFVDGASAYDQSASPVEWPISGVYNPGLGNRNWYQNATWIKSSAFNAIQIFNCDNAVPSGAITWGGVQLGLTTYVEIPSSPAGAAGFALIWMEGGVLKAREGTGAVVNLLGGGAAPMTLTMDDGDTVETTAALMIAGSTDANKRMFMGFQTSSDFGYIGARNTAGARPLVLQPDGGLVYVGTVGNLQMDAGNLSATGVVTLSGAASGVNVTTSALWNTYQTSGGIRSQRCIYQNFDALFDPVGDPTGIYGKRTTPEANVHVQNTGLSQFVCDAYGGGAAGVLVGRRALGSVAAPSALGNGDVMLIIGGRGWAAGASDFAASLACAISFTAKTDGSFGSTWSGSSQASEITFQTTALASTTRATRMTISPAGNVAINGIDAQSSLTILDGYIDSAEGGTSTLGKWRAAQLTMTNGSDATERGGFRWSGGQVQYSNDMSVWNNFGGSGGISDVLGTANQITSSVVSGVATISLPVTLITPGSVQTGGTLQVDGVALGIGIFATSGSVSGVGIVSTQNAKDSIRTIYGVSAGSSGSNAGYYILTTRVISGDGVGCFQGIVMADGCGASGFSYYVSDDGTTWTYRGGGTDTIVVGADTYQFEGGILTRKNSVAYNTFSVDDPFQD